MSNWQPTVSVIIPTRPGQATILAVDAARQMDYPPGKVEILVARGRQPACQRNAALRQAAGELVYFLDDDARPQPGNLVRALPHFRRADVMVVGGPNVCPAGAPWGEKVFALVLGCWLGMGPSRARYEPVGAVRPTNEKELILCNLLARRQALLDLGGFDEALYPNEENALMDVLQQRGGQLIYDPHVTVERRPRPTLGAFARMFLTYGRGRAEQFRRHPTKGSILNFVPPLFVAYLLVGPWWGWLGLAPLAAYVLALGGQTLLSILRHGLGRSLAAAPLIVLAHVLYGLGFWRGLTTRIPDPSSRRADSSVTIETIQPLSCVPEIET